MPDIALGRKPDGTTDEVRLDDDGALKVATTGPEGAELATEATAERTANATEVLAGTVGAGQPTAEDDAVAVAFKPGQEVITSPAATFADATAAQAAPDLGATYVAGDVSVTSPDLAAIRSNTDELEDDAERTADAAENIAPGIPDALGPALMIGAVPIVFAIDHPPVPAELYVGGNPLSNANPVFVRGIVPSRTPTGTPVATASGQIGSNGAGALLYFRGHLETPGGTRYVLLFDAASGDALTTAKLIPNVGFPVSVTQSRFEQRFGYPLSFASGLRWAVSTTEHTYTASADTAFVFAQWIQL